MKYERSVDGILREYRVSMECSLKAMNLYTELGLS